MATTKKLMGTTAVGGADLLAIEDVFSTYLYTGNDSTQTITNGIDLAGEGGLVWLKERSALYTDGHWWVDTLRGVNEVIKSNTTTAQGTINNSVTAFNSNGFSIGANASFSSTQMSSWTFRKAPRFFDVVTYTGNFSSQTIPHNLGTAPGFIVIKRTDSTSYWVAYHRSLGNTQGLALDLTDAAFSSSSIWDSTSPDENNFYIGGNPNNNVNGGSYVAYLFAHDPLGPSGDGSDGLIACGSFTTDANEDATIDLGWEPQWVLFKRTDSSTGGNWNLYDTMRGMQGDFVSQAALLEPDTTDAENTDTNRIAVTPTGFKVDNYGANREYIYIAIRRGPMRQPTSGTEVFRPASRGETESVTYDVQLYSGWPVDLVLERNIASGNDGVAWWDRLRGGPGTAYYLKSSDTNDETSSGLSRPFDTMHGFRAGDSSTNYNNLNGWLFRRAPGFFDVVAYKGTGTQTTRKHNLGVTPELIIIKGRDYSGTQWYVYKSPWQGAGSVLFLNLTQAELNGGTTMPINPTETEFTTSDFTFTNNASYNFIAYLFATLPGVSKVGSYTGNGTSQTIDCGFTSGARFILIKRTDSTGDWYVWDTARGIVAANDPHLSLNTTAAEVTTDDSVDPDSSGFIVNQVSATNINVNAASYIFYAIA